MVYSHPIDDNVVMMNKNKLTATVNQNGNFRLLTSDGGIFGYVVKTHDGMWRVNPMVAGLRGSRTTSATPQIATDRYFGKGKVSFGILSALFTVSGPVTLVENVVEHLEDLKAEVPCIDDEHGEFAPEWYPLNAAVEELETL
jgi:hypothetical protein